MDASKILAPVPRLVAQLSFMCSPEQLTQLKELAARANLSQAELARRLLQDATERLLAATTAGG